MRRSDVFAALADDTRRAILDLFRERSSLTAGEIASAFPRISRPAVSKHLAVLRRAGLVNAEERGREWHYSIDARPLGEIAHEWLQSFAPLWERSLRQLKERVESPRRDKPGGRRR